MKKNFLLIGHFGPAGMPLTLLNRFHIVPRHVRDDIRRLDGPVGPSVGHTLPSPYILNDQPYPYVTITVKRRSDGVISGRGGGSAPMC